MLLSRELWRTVVDQILSDEKTKVYVPSNAAVVLRFVCLVVVIGQGVSLVEGRKEELASCFKIIDGTMVTRCLCMMLLDIFPVAAQTQWNGGSEGVSEGANK